MTYSKNNIWKFEYLYLFIAIISLVLIIWQHYAMDRTLLIYPSPTSHASVFGDEINGGRSISQLTENKEGARLDCQIRLSGTFSFCSLNISIADAVDKGLNLDSFTQLQIWVEHKSTYLDTLLIYLENSEKRGYKSTKPINKSNMVALLANTSEHFYTLPLQDFYVPSWWILQNKASGAKAAKNLHNVMSLRLATGDNTEARNVSITLKKAQFSGKWIKAQTLYLALLINWIAVIAINAIYRLYRLNRELRSKRHKTTMLAELNKLLHVQKNQFETLAKTDPLTGISNRIGTRDILQDLQNKRAKVCSLIMFDIDHFKKVNDSYGHTEGDSVLRKLADLVHAEIREGDHCARWGGEEFIIICPDTYSGIAYSVAEELRHKIANTGLCVHSQITCSFGVAECHMSGEDSINRLFEAADKAMYQAKKAGRNRVDLALHKS